MERSLVVVCLSMFCFAVNMQCAFAQNSFVLPARKSSTTDEIRERIDAALDTVVDMHFEAASLSEVASKIADQFMITVLLDIGGLDLAGVGREDEVSFTANNVRLRSGLNRLCRDLDLTYLIIDDSLILTSTEAAGENLVTGVYDVTEMIVDVAQNSIVVSSDSRRDADERMENLEVLISTSIAPESWEENGGTSSYAFTPVPSGQYFISISQTEACHQKIRELLQKIESLTKQPAKPVDPDKILVRVYPVTGDVVTFQEAEELLKLTLEDAQWDDPHFIKVVGKTLVIKQTAKTHLIIANILSDLKATSRETIQSQWNGLKSAR